MRTLHRLAPVVLLSTLMAAGAVHAQGMPVAPTPTEVKPAVDQAFTQLLAAPAVKQLLDAVKADHERSIEDLKMLTEIEAPPFKEQQRAEAFLARIKALGLSDAKIDAEGNVVALRKGTGTGPKLLVAAHLDTVFPAGTDVKVKERDGKLHAPGIADDTRGLAVLLSWLKVLWNVTSLSASSKLIGDRPSGRTPADSVIVEAAVRSNTAFGHRTQLHGGSTDANVPKSLGIPAIIVGGGKASGFHALNEWIDLTDAWKGAQNSLVTVLGLVGVQGVSEPLLPKRAPRAK
jgi:acetylornithine deacetylase/succinyl-diaminopimelate desuccinylase-like protein